MEIRFEVITKAQLLKLQSEASEVPFLYHGIPLKFKMARGLVLGIDFGEFSEAPDVPRHLTLVGAFSPFRLSVWRELLRVQSGETLTYTQLAERTGRNKAVRAVASAVAANPFACIVPCHRIVPASGGTGQYRWGSARKANLIKAEQLMANRD